MMLLTHKKFPYLSAIILSVIIFVCLFAEIFMNHSPTFMNLSSLNLPPNSEFYFGTDMMGRDIFSMILYGGRISLFVGITSTLISTSIAVIYGYISGISSKTVDTIMMRFVDIILSVPSILTVIFVQAILGMSNTISISIVIGVTSWMSIAKVIETEVKQLRQSDYILASKCMGGNFFHILRYHMIPNFIPSIMFMVVNSISSAIAAEATLSFLGIGIPVEIVSWGSMLSQADRAIMSNSWWIVVIPGIFLVTTVICIADVGNYIHVENSKGCRKL